MIRTKRKTQYLPTASSFIAYLYLYIEKTCLGKETLQMENSNKIYIRGYIFTETSLYTGYHNIPLIMKLKNDQIYTV